MDLHQLIYVVRDKLIPINRKVLFQKFFPDFAERIAYQKQQEKYYRSAQAKLEEMKKLRRLDKSSCLTASFISGWLLKDDQLDNMVNQGASKP